MGQKSRQLRAYAFSDHEGVSREKIPIKRIQESITQFSSFHDQMIYAHLLYEEKCILGSNGANELGYRDKSFDVVDLIEKVHPEDLDEVYRLTNKAFNAVYSHQNIHSLRYHVTYRIKKTDHQYIRVLRETIPYLTDQQEKIISTISRYTDISNLGHPKEIKAWLTSPHKIIDLSSEFKNLLSRREKEILHYLAKGFSSKIIANHLSISKLTVDKHRCNMLRKTKTANTSELIKLAIEKGVID